MQQNIDKLLVQVQKELKKKMFPRKHRKLLCNEVIIETGDLDDRVQGTYETIENTEYKYKFIHKITISKKVYYEYENGLSGMGFCKTFTKQRIKEVIAHELIHAYVYEKYEFCACDYKYHCDGSPIFLSMLAFLNISSGHKAMDGFKHTETYKKVKEYDSFEKLEIFLIHLMCEYEKELRQLSELVEETNVYLNSFQFSNGDITGVKGYSTITMINQGKIGKANIFIIGANADIGNMKTLVLSKIHKNVFKNKYVMQGSSSIEEKRGRLKLQTMNI
mgnify:CR=1 FL=1